MQWISPVLGRLPHREYKVKLYSHLGELDTGKLESGSCYVTVNLCYHGEATWLRFISVIYNIAIRFREIGVPQGPFQFQNYISYRQDTSVSTYTFHSGSVGGENQRERCLIFGLFGLFNHQKGGIRINVWPVPHIPQDNVFCADSELTNNLLLLIMCFNYLDFRNS